MQQLLVSRLSNSEANSNFNFAKSPLKKINHLISNLSVNFSTFTETIKKAFIIINFNKHQLNVMASGIVNHYIART